MQRPKMTDSAERVRAIGFSAGSRWTRRALLAGAGGALLVPGAASAFQATPTGSVQLEVTPNPVPLDQPFAVRVSGLEPGARVTVRATVTDARFVPWRSEGAFVADDRGVVDLADQAPVEGTWATADPTALVWSAAPPSLPDRRFFAPSLYLDQTTITVEVAGAEVAQRRGGSPPAHASRRRLHGGRRRPGGPVLPPGQGGPYPGVLVLGGSEGGLRPFTAAKLATHGLATLALAYFGVSDVAAEARRDPAGVLRGRPRLAPGPAVRRARTVGGRRPVARGRAGAPPRRDLPRDRRGRLVCRQRHRHAVAGEFAIPAWTYRGEPVPQFFDPNTANEAAIPVERIGGPVLLDLREADRLWPSALLSDIAMDRLRVHGQSVSARAPAVPGCRALHPASTCADHVLLGHDGWNS